MCIGWYICVYVLHHNVTSPFIQSPTQQLLLRSPLRQFGRYLCHFSNMLRSLKTDSLSQDTNKSKNQLSSIIIFVDVDPGEKGFTKIPPFHVSYMIKRSVTKEVKTAMTE